MRLIWFSGWFAVACAARTIPAEHYSSLAEALSAARNNSVVQLPEGYRAILHAPLAIRGSNVTLRCAERAAIIKAFDGDAINITGSGISIEGCTVDGQRSRYHGGLVNVNGASGVQIRNDILFNTAGLAIGIYRSSSVKVIGCTLTGNQGSALFAQDNLDDIEIASNQIDSASVPTASGTNTIGIHTWERGGFATNINIHDNMIRHGGNNFGVEVGAFGAGAIPPAGVAVAQNTFVLAAKSNGAISLSTLNRGSVTGNVIDANRNVLSIAAIELVSTIDVTVSQNSLKNAVPENAYTMTIDGGRRNTVVANRWEGGLYIGTSRPDWALVDDNLIEHNVFTVLKGSAVPRGVIWLQCNTRNCSLSRNRIRDNVLNGDNAALGVNLENDYGGRGGRMDSNEVRANQMKAVRQETSIGSGVMNTITNRPD